MKEKRNRWVQKIGMAFTALFCMAVLALLPYREVLANVQGTVTASSANIRASADVNSTALASVLSGNKVEIIEEVTGTDNQKWYKVVIDADSTGYIRADLVQKGEGTVPTGTLTPSTPAPAASSDPSTSNTNVTVNTEGVVEVQPVSASVTNDQVRVRADSSTSSSIVTIVRQNVVLTVHGTKAGNNNDTWYYVSFLMDNNEVSGFVRSDFVTLEGELVPPEEAPAETVPETPVEPVETPSQIKAYETLEVDGVWYLLDNGAGEQYQLSKLFSASDQNATELDNAQKKIKRLNGILIFLCILLVVLVLAVTVLIFKIRDMSEDDGFDLPFRRSSGSGSGNVRPANSRPSGTSRPSGARPAGSRPTGQGSRPVSQGTSRPSGSSSGGVRPAQGSGGNRPTGQGSRPAGSAPTSSRPVNQGANGTNRPAGSRPTGQNSRPVSQTAADRAAEEKLEKQAQADVEARNIEKNMASNPARQSKNFLSDDDEFEFEFLNWDGDEE